MQVSLSRLYFGLAVGSLLTNVLLHPEDLARAHSMLEVELPRDKGSSVMFHPFSDPPELHNTTVDGKTLPGPFHDDQLFLLGTRITTSFEPENQSVFVDLFGFPGDWFTRRLSYKTKPFCPHGDPYDGHLIHYKDMVENVTLYCQIECRVQNVCGKIIPMDLVPLISGDVNQRETTFIWRCNVSQIVRKDDLVDQSKKDDKQALRVKFWISRRDSPGMKEVTTVDIPLRTAVAGYGGPQIRHNNYFTQQRFRVGLALATYGLRTRPYLVEFIQHHLNVGFEQIVIGIQTTPGSDDMRSAQQLLAPYLEQGTVVLAATGHDSYFECDNAKVKLHFLHQSLYYFKGLAPYAATWDIDEHWLPPEELQEESITQHGNVRGNKKPVSESFSHVVLNDAIWRNSSYAKSISVGRVMDAIETYYGNDAGCGGEWCYHLFPSYNVHLLEGKKATGKNRLHLHVHDFGKRDGISNKMWQKAIANTKVAHMSGLHLPGSCKYGNEEKYYRFSTKGKKCRRRAEGPKRFGHMHHFFNLVSIRAHNKQFIGNMPLDEYIKNQYGHTVMKQLEAQNKSRSAAQ